MTTAHATGILRESYSQGGNTEFEVDAENSVIKGVALLQETSRNGRTYTAKARESAKRIYEGRPVHINHGNFENYDTRNGELQNIRESKNKRGLIIGDHHLNSKKQSTPGILEDAEKFPNSMAYSHEIPEDGYEAELDESGHLHVSDLFECDCFAIVTEGGVNKSIKENLNPPKRPEMSEKLREIRSKHGLREAYPVLVEELTKDIEECACKEFESKEKDLVTENTDLKKRVEELEAQMKEAKDKADKSGKESKVKEMAEAKKVKLDPALIEKLAGMDESDAKLIIDNMKPSVTESFDRQGSTFGDDDNGKDEWSDAERGIFGNVI